MGPSHDESDERLAQRARGGERDAFEQLVHRYGNAVHAVVEKQVQDHHLALDLAQDVWIKVFRALCRWKPSGSFRSWLFSIALNHVRDDRRRQSRHNVVYLERFRSHPSAPRAADPKGRAEEHAVIHQCMREVGEPYRTALYLVDMVGLSYEEAAHSLSCATGTVKSRVSRGRFAFRDHYVRLAGEPEAPESTSGKAGATS